MTALGEPYARVFRASAEDRIDMIRRGVPAAEVKKMIRDLGMEQRGFYQALGLKTATVNRKVKHHDRLSPDESERLLGVAKLMGQLEAMISESGESEGFDASGWMANWLRQPLGSLGGKAPFSFLDTMEGQTLVATALAQIQSGAYA
ncbi:MAG: DUF2384 domain-containing protein [Beijerinckiaceae bacterium]|nr:DUF2384 domain-containing protein [Beijerinckiaceae bacterium]